MGVGEKEEISWFSAQKRILGQKQCVMQFHIRSAV